MKVSFIKCDIEGCENKVSSGDEIELEDWVQVNVSLLKGTAQDVVNKGFRGVYDICPPHTKAFNYWLEGGRVIIRPRLAGEEDDFDGFYEDLKNYLGPKQSEHLLEAQGRLNRPIYNMSESEILRIPLFGRKKLEEIKRLVKLHNLVTGVEPCLR